MPPRAQKQNRGRLRQLMGDKRKRERTIAAEVDRLVTEYAQGRAAASCWIDLMKAASEGK